MHPGDGRTPCTSCIEKHLKVEPAASEADAVAAITRDSLCTYDAFVRRRGKGKKTIIKEEEERFKRSTSALLDRPPQQQQQQQQISTAFQVPQQPQQRSPGVPLYGQEPPLQFSRGVAQAAPPAYLPLGGVGIGIGVAGMPGASDVPQLLQVSYEYPRGGLGASLGSSTMSAMSMSVPSGATAPASMSGSGSPESTDLTSSLAGTGLRMGKLNLDPALNTAPAGLQPPGPGQTMDNPGNHNIRYF